MTTTIEGRPARHTPGELRRDETTRLLKLLADPNRRAILRAIDGRRSVRELEVAAGISQALASYDVSMMRLEGLVEPVRDGQYVRYALTAKGARAARLIEELAR